MTDESTDSSTNGFENPPVYREPKRLVKAAVSSAIGMPTVSSTLMLIGSVVIVLLRDGRFESWPVVLFVLAWMVPISLFMSCDMWLCWRNWWFGEISDSKMGGLRDVFLKCILFPACLTILLLCFAFPGRTKVIPVTLLVIFILMTIDVWRQ